MSELKIGDVVKLKSGGPEMTIDHIGDYSGTQKARCVWFDKANEKDALFVLATLKLFVAPTRQRVKVIR